MLIHILQMNKLKIQLGFLLEEVKNVQDVGVVHEEVEDVGVFRIHLVESQELIIGSSSRGQRRRQSFESTMQDTINGYKEFQRQSLQQLCPGAFDKDDYDEFKKAEQIFLALELPKFTKFYWACINSLKELVFWRKYFIDIVGSNNKDKLQLLEAMTGVTRNNEDVPKQLGSGQLFGSPHSGSLSSGSPAFVGNSLRENSFQNWGAPPTTQQWGTPPNVQHWGTPPNVQYWGHHQMLNHGVYLQVVQVGTHPPNVQQWSTPPYPMQWNIPQNFHHGQHASNFQQVGSSGTTPTNVQFGFTVGNQVESPMNNQRKYPEGTTTNASPKVHQTPSLNIGFTHYFESGSTSQQPRHGGLFNIWGTTEEHNAGHQSDSGDED